MSRLFLGAMALATLAGCAQVTPDAGFKHVQALTQPHLPVQPQWSRTGMNAQAQAKAQARIQALLARPLSIDDAVELALLNNQGLQAAFDELGMAEADLVQASRLPNPGVSFGRVQRGEELELERGFHINVLRVLLMPWSTQAEGHRMAQVRHQAALQTLSLASEVRKAWVLAVAAQQALHYSKQVLKAADASEELASRLARTGNWSALDHAREQAFYAEAGVGVARATQAHVVAHEQLIRLLGLWGDQANIQLPDRLPDLPKAPDELPDIERQAMAQRLDLAAMKARSEALARALGLTRITGVVNVLELGRVHNTSNEAPRQTGYEVGLELPLFDWGGARVARAESTYMQSMHQLAEAAVHARSQIRLAYQRYRINHDIARHYRDEVIPLRKRISDENVLRYNGMLTSVFDLLADAQAQTAAVNSYIQALRDFWLAQNDLAMVRVGPIAANDMTGTGTSLPQNNLAAGH
jgi:outer membrane protein TolC